MVKWIHLSLKFNNNVIYNFLCTNHLMMVYEPKNEVVEWDNRIGQTIDIIIDFNRFYYSLIYFIVVSTASELSNL
jgi:hypothetical protein